MFVLARTMPRIKCVAQNREMTIVGFSCRALHDGVTSESLMIQPKQSRWVTGPYFQDSTFFVLLFQFSSLIIVLCACTRVRVCVVERHQELTRTAFLQFLAWSQSGTQERTGDRVDHALDTKLKSCKTIWKWLIEEKVKWKRTRGRARATLECHSLSRSSWCPFALFNVVAKRVRSFLSCEELISWIQSTSDFFYDFFCDSSEVWIF